MTKLQWDQAGRRLFEAGVDRGVLYLSDNRGVAWSGITSIEEDFSEDTTEAVYFDGVKVNDVVSLGDFAADLNAFTYPDEFLPYEGIKELAEGLYADDQESRMFGMSFRTLVGNDLDYTDLGYKLHILYNLTAVPGGVTRETKSDVVNPQVFTWGLTTVPVKIEDYRATAHIYFDSRFLPPDILEAIEDILYGTGASDSVSIVYDGGGVGDIPTGEIDGGGPSDVGEELPETTTGGVNTEPRLPSIEELMDLVLLWAPKTIVPHTDTGLAELVDGPNGDFTQTIVQGVFTALPDNRLIESSSEGLYILP